MNPTMHELSLASSVVQILSEEAQRHEMRRVTRYRLEVGLLRGVVPELLFTCLGFASKGTAVEGAAVDLQEVPGRARCWDCSLEFAVDEIVFLCPRCERLGGEIIAGQELRVIAMEGE
jgi:hydrogenase nickel incorporation protein HypA/HybF